MRTRMTDLEGGGVSALMADEGIKAQRREVERKMDVHVQQILSTQPEQVGAAAVTADLVNTGAAGGPGKDGAGEGKR